MFFTILLLCIFNYNVVESYYDKIAESHKYSVLLQNLLNNNMPITHIKELDKECIHTCNNVIIYNCDMYSYYLNILNEIIVTKKTIINKTQQSLDITLNDYNALMSNYDYTTSTLGINHPYKKLIADIKYKLILLFIMVSVIAIMFIIGFMLVIFGSFNAYAGYYDPTEQTYALSKQFIHDGLITLGVGISMWVISLIIYFCGYLLQLNINQLLHLKSQYESTLM